MSKMRATDRPIIFSAPMIRALLAGRKTMTRRILNLPQVGSLCVERGRPYTQHADGVYRPVEPIWRTGDHLWVRESLKARNMDLGGALGFSEPLKALDMKRGDLAASYAADGEECVEGAGFDLAWAWKRPTLPSIHMPRAFSRLTLLIDSVKVERLNDISEEDAIAEGIPQDYLEHVHGPGGFRDLWESLHGPGSWAANSWIAALRFRVIRANDDSE